jgi:hypothetical protein
MGIATDDEWLLDEAQKRFDTIWRGAECGSCKLRRECPKPIDTIQSKTAARSKTAAPRTK